MPLEKSIIKASSVEKSTFEYKPREIDKNASKVARSFVNEDAFISTDFKISELVAQQAGISKLEDDALRDKINEQVLDRLKEVQEKAYQEGYELGVVEGTEKAFQDSRADLLARLQGMEDILARIEHLKSELLIDHEAALVRLVYLIAKKLALRELEQNREAVAKILQDVVGDIQADERITVRLSVADLKFIEGLQEKGGHKIESLKRVKFVPDEAVRPGGCLIETEYGNVDATIEERLERTWQTLEGRIPHKPG
jgi:flagellar assembly protein FliH